MIQPPATIERAYRLRAYPTAAQRAVLARLIGATRHVWNWALEQRRTAYGHEHVTLNWVALSKRYTAYRRCPDRPWLAALPRDPFIQTLRNLEAGYQRFFSNLKLPKGKCRRVGLPGFKRRGENQSVRFTLDQRRMQVDRGTGRWAWVDLPGLGRIKLRRSETLVGRLRSVTVTRDGGGRYFASFTADQVPAPAPLIGGVKAIGIDRGLRDLLTVYGGAAVRSVPAPKPLSRNLLRLRRYQRKQARQIRAQMRAQGLDPSRPCPKGTRLGMSHRRLKTKRRIARLHARVAEIRRDVTQRATTDLVRGAEVIGIETLRVAAMQRGMGRRGFRRAVGDAAMGEVARELEYKAAWYQRIIVKVDPYFRSSKRCHVCGHVNHALRLEKHWRCPHCGTYHDRDVNAAINLREEALRILAAQSPASPERDDETHAERHGSVWRPQDHQTTGCVETCITPAKGAVRRPSPPNVASGTRRRVGGMRL